MTTIDTSPAGDLANTVNLLRSDTDTGWHDRIAAVSDLLRLDDLDIPAKIAAARALADDLQEAGEVRADGHVRAVCGRLMAEQNRAGHRLTQWAEPATQSSDVAD